jgi:hypothetical protein
MQLQERTKKLYIHKYPNIKNISNHWNEFKNGPRLWILSYKELAVGYEVTTFTLKRDASSMRIFCDQLSSKLDSPSLLEEMNFVLLPKHVLHDSSSKFLNGSPS